MVTFRSCRVVRVAAFFVFLAVTFGAMTSGPEAAGLEDDVAALAVKSFKKKIAAVERLGAARDARAVPTLRALLDGDLFYRKSDRRVVIARKRGTTYILLGPLTGAELGDAAKRTSRKSASTTGCARSFAVCSAD